MEQNTRRLSRKRRIKGRIERVGSGVKKKTEKLIGDAATLHLLTNLIYRETPQNTKEWIMTDRSSKEKEHSGGEFPLVEHMKQRERISRRFRKRQTIIENVARRAIREELFHKSRMRDSKLYSLFNLEAAWFFPYEGQLKFGSVSLNRPINLYGVIFRQNEYEIPFKLNDKEIRTVKYLGSEAVGSKIKPQVLKYVPPMHHEELGGLIDKTLMGSHDFGNYTLSLEYPRGYITEFYVFIPTTSIRYNPILHKFTTYQGILR